MAPVKRIKEISHSSDKVKKSLTILSFVFIALQARAQDPHFSQFFSSPLTLNPANTGNFSGFARASANYRNQWPSFGNAYSTSTASIDGTVFKKLIPEGDRLSLGLLMLSDQSGNGILKENHLGVSAAYTKGLDMLGKHSITAGFQGSFSSLGFDQNKANFEDEISASGFTLPSSEVLLSRDLGRQYLDMHAGLLYKGSFSENDLFYAGASVYHLKTPSLGFSSPNYFIQRRYNVHGGGYIALGYATTVHASFQYQQQFNYKEFLLGGAISQLLVDKQKTYTELYAGAWIRNNDAIIPYLGIEWNSLRAGFSYDINYSKRKAASAMYQSAEISLNWIFNMEEGALTVKCPKF
ncbi:MAG: hypothetical protein RLZZ05_397 [Bacteroidota bacterium]